MEVTHTMSQSARSLNEAIQKAIEDHQITTSEYEKILHLADADGVIDSSERSLLAELNNMIADGSIKRIPD